MPKPRVGFRQFVKNYFGDRYNQFNNAYGETVSDIFGFPFKILFTPLTLAFDIAGSAPRGFGVPELVSKLSAASVFAVATLGTYDIALNLGKKVICPRNCGTCNGWQALRCTMCRGSGRVHYQVKNCTLKSGERATAESVADAIFNNRAELVHIPASLDPQIPLPSKDCPICDATGVMGCPECKNKLPLRISADGIMEPPWQALNVLEKMEYPYEHIRHSMKDPGIAAFWLITFPQIMYGFTYGDNAKQAIGSEYQESRRYDLLRDEVAQRKPGWEFLQDALISIDPDRAREDPVIVKNVPYYKAKKALEEEVMKLDPPPRPSNWGELDLPLSSSSWGEEELKDPEKFQEMTVLLKAQREISENILNVQWETKWRQEKVNELLEEKVQPYIQNIDNEVLSEPILLKPKKQEKNHRQRKWFFFF
ncbi:uncharacterized protein LOC131627989 [Vicia villosa]|uniref:uncharacterized protein LOC131627989 n=1 Tax=Vicia villosa TaxID=3911 RepID=UPI00273C6F7D|nr:uncharacterized protein LOC131627989 [Vicia villosa]